MHASVHGTLRTECSLYNIAADKKKKEFIGFLGGPKGGGDAIRGRVCIGLLACDTQIFQFMFKLRCLCTVSYC